jgi:hypothetical protein
VLIEWPGGRELLQSAEIPHQAAQRAPRFVAKRAALLLGIVLAPFVTYFASYYVLQVDQGRLNHDTYIRMYRTDFEAYAFKPAARVESVYTRWNVETWNIHWFGP